MGKIVYKRSDGYTETRLLQSAVDHLASARLLFKSDPRCYDSAGYLSHLGIELVLKALLLNRSGGFPNEHDLAKLGRKLEQEGQQLNYSVDHVTVVKKLSDFFELRYPITSNGVEIGKDDWSHIESLFNHLALLLPGEIQQSMQWLDRTTKGNRVLMRRLST